MITCPSCGRISPPGTRFCGNCATPLAVATPATVGVPVAVPLPPPPPAYYFPVQAAVHKSTSRRAWALIAGGLVALMIALGAIAVAVTRPPANCQVPCPGPPPSAPPLGPAQAFTSTKFGYSLEYTDGGGRITAAPADVGVTFSIDGNPAILFEGFDASGKSAQQAVEERAVSAYPGSTPVYTIPGAEMGYNPGFGEVFDFQTAGSGQSEHARIIIVAAIRKGVGVLMVAAGPYRAPDPTKDGHPIPANTIIGFYSDPIMNTVRWPGDPTL